MKIKIVPIVASVALITFSPRSADCFTVAGFDPVVVFSGTGAPEQDAMNAAVGVTGFAIEDFEDVKSHFQLKRTDSRESVSPPLRAA